eukprot:m.840319 g.840319  ORF g.840319 m.840319 type:complete len:496 (+) comp59509_c0_seq5:1783-3270(+)
MASERTEKGEKDDSWASKHADCKTFTLSLRLHTPALLLQNARTLFGFQTSLLGLCTGLGGFLLQSLLLFALLPSQLHFLQGLPLGLLCGETSLSLLASGLLLALTLPLSLSELFFHASLGVFCFLASALELLLGLATQFLHFLSCALGFCILLVNLLLKLLPLLLLRQPGSLRGLRLPLLHPLGIKCVVGSLLCALLSLEAVALALVFACLESSLLTDSHSLGICSFASAYGFLMLDFFRKTSRLDFSQSFLSLLFSAISCLLVGLLTSKKFLFSTSGLLLQLQQALLLLLSFKSLQLGAVLFHFGSQCFLPGFLGLLVSLATGLLSLLACVFLLAGRTRLLLDKLTGLLSVLGSLQTNRLGLFACILELLVRPLALFFQSSLLSLDFPIALRCLLLKTILFKLSLAFGQVSFALGKLRVSQSLFLGTLQFVLHPLELKFHLLSHPLRFLRFGCCLETGCLGFLALGLGAFLALGCLSFSSATVGHAHKHVFLLE